MLPLGAICLAAVVLLWSSPSAAQEWLDDRQYGEGRGVRLGDSLVFHPGVGVEAGYNSNVFHTDANEPGSGILRVAVDLDLATRPPQRREESNGTVQQGNIDFRLGVNAAYYEYLTSDDIVQEQRNVALGADLNLHILPTRPFSVILTDNFVRDIQPQNEVGPRNFNRDDNDARVTFQIAPGGGLFSIRFGYGFQLRYFEDDGNSGALQAMGNFTSHEAFASVRWRFLPKTALTFTGSFLPVFHNGDGTSPREVHDSYHVRGAVGLVGLLTRRFSLIVEAGYGAGFYLDGGPDYDSFVGSLGLRFHISPTVRISLQYNRDFSDTVFSDYYSRDRVSATYSHLIAGRVMLKLDVGFSYIGYSQVEYSGVGGSFDRSDPLVTAQLFAEYRIRDWIGINATLEYLGNFTSFVATTPESLDDPGEYQRFTALAGVRVMY